MGKRLRHPPQSLGFLLMAPAFEVGVDAPFGTGSEAKLGIAVPPGMPGEGVAVDGAYGRGLSGNGRDRSGNAHQCGRDK